MRKLDIAEVILSFTADRERAAAIAGDLAEEYRGSAVRFWWLVAQTSFLQTGRQLSAAPFEMVGTAIQAILFQVVYLFAVFMATHDGFTTALAWALSPAPTFQSETISWLYIPFSLGMDAARGKLGREYPVIVSWLLLQAILSVAASLFRWEFLGVQGTVAHEVLAGFVWFAAAVPASFLIATGGAAFMRSRLRRRGAHA